ncbi:calcium uptake protein 2, mitochondrial isoform X3 [Phyllostomus discolor]|uniref:Calcium uptake protein 2, mitochondrial isoform X3 n=1 Tax=Phyllostomus discolor TaxID=89673 RepID=A0A7E6D5J7_9CHIR|nr:calcium uptake protein 2, mitochondrial isoform X3 [Phyllostomus discolor]
MAAAAAAAAAAAWVSRLAAGGSRLLRGVTAGLQTVRASGSVAASVASLALAGAGVALYHGRVNGAAPQGRLTVQAQENASSGKMMEKLSLRKQRFMQFSSLEHEGAYYMTPRDFLFSVMFEHIERKTSVKKLTKKDIEDVLAAIQRTHCGSTFFRDLGDKGLISYTEYLFLLTILTKPHTGFHVAFKMLDADGDEMVEKKEFFKEPEVKESEINTTLQIRFFGKRGERKLHYREFRRFMENLQTEVQEMEFLQFSKGLSFMRKEDFAEWLLFFTNTENKDIYWKNVREKLSAGESISLDEFKSFCHFTTHLEDFAIAMQMFNLAHRPVRLAEFKRAVKVATGQELSNNILDTVFKIFDLDGDECLSHGEFLGVLKNRMHRGLWVTQQQSVQEYWKCVKKESIRGVKEVWKKAGKGLF